MWEIQAQQNLPYERDPAAQDEGLEKFKAKATA